jgi:hypothetical protein
MLLGRENGSMSAIEAAGNAYGEDSSVCSYLKAAVAAGSVLSGTWGEQLVAASDQQEFFAAVRQGSIVGKLGLREVPLNCRVLGITDGSRAYWVKAGSPKPVGYINFAGNILPPLKMAALLVSTQEVVRHASPQAEVVFREDMQRACIELLDQAFIDAANAGLADVAPASITYGVSSNPSSGNPAADVAGLVETFRGDWSSAAFVTDPTTAGQFTLSRDGAGNFQFPDASPRGGALIGVPLIVSRSSPRDTSGGQLALVDGSGIAFGAEGIRLARSQVATIEMESEPDDPVGAATVQVSLWQMNLAGVLVEISANWTVSRPGSVAVLTNVDYAVPQS